MTTIKCSECKKEISPRAKYCPQCGALNRKVFCRFCGTEMDLSDNVCPNCNNRVVNETAQFNQNDEKGQNFDLALASLIASVTAPIVGLIIAIIVLNNNKGKTNSAKTYATVALAISVISTIITLVVYFFYIILSVPY